MAEPSKDTIYIDIDDEITAVIDKVRVSKADVVALVLPKRASVFQSIVNMKLLKKAAGDAKKHVVLITTEASLLPLAGAAGLHVSKNLSSKPEIPKSPSTKDAPKEAVEEEPEEVTAADYGAVAVGTLAGLPPSGEDNDVETLELEDDVPPEEVTDGEGEAESGPKLKKNKKLQVPNFERFRLSLTALILAAILLLSGMIYALKALPKAQILVSTDATSLNVSLSFNANTKASVLDPTTNTLPAKTATQQKTYTQSADATGQKNVGNPATGNVVFYNCDKNDLIYGQDETIPKGTGITSGSLVYITQASVNVSPSSYKLDGTCKKNVASSSVPVTAQAGGTAYNLSGPVSFSVSLNNPGFPGDGHTFSASSSAGMSGGTDSNKTVVSQADIDGAKAKISTTDPTAKQALEQQLNQLGMYPLDATFNAGKPTVTTSANVGDAVSSVTVTEQVTYTMFGVTQTDLKTLIDNSVSGQIDTSKQKVSDEGVAAASMALTGSDANSAQISLTTTAVAGPHLDINTIKTESAGKKPGDVKSALMSNPDVTNVTVKLSPFWVSSVPHNTKKITVVISKPSTTKSTSTNANP